MERKKRRILPLLYSFLLLLICFPFLRSRVWPHPEAPLYGVEPQIHSVFFSYDTWFDTSWSTTFTAWHARHFGFRNLLVRMHNQFGYTVFGHVYSNQVTVGRDGYLFDKLYIRAYTGEDFLGPDTLSAYLDQLAAVHQALHEKGIELIFVFAPGKASFFPEYLPPETAPPGINTNYRFLRKGMAERGLPHADFVRWFDILKPGNPYPLFPKCGIHWSYYGALLAHDSLNGLAGDLLGTPLPRISVDHVRVTDSLRPVDHDVGMGMNLLREPEGYPCAYAEYHFQPRNFTPQHRLLTVGDSYYWTTEPWQYQGTVYEKVKYLYYNKELHTWDGSPSAQISEAEIVRLSLEQDVIVLLSTDANLFRLSWGYVDLMYRNLEQIRKAPVRRATADGIAAMMKTIRTTPEWYASVVRKAEERHISTDSMLYLDAVFMLEHPAGK